MVYLQWYVADVPYHLGSGRVKGHASCGDIADIELLLVYNLIGHHCETVGIL